MEFKEGDYVSFKGNAIKIYGYICRVNDDNTIDYIRDSLTRWNVGKFMINNGEVITEDEFISKVQYKANKSDQKIPTPEEILTVLNMYKTNFDVDMSEIISVLK